mmetsp:Transcript_53513/g.104674  ORF Transcript_53513/g.104674 Transcript_53513/m.104674 type:complete len:125 (-) Transcript_53513:202-576(-)
MFAPHTATQPRQAPSIHPFIHSHKDASPHPLFIYTGSPWPLKDEGASAYKEKKEQGGKQNANKPTPESQPGLEEKRLREGRGRKEVSKNGTERSGRAVSLSDRRPDKRKETNQQHRMQQKKGKK